MDILLKLKEKGKQSISLTGGVSGLAGSFIGLSYQTNNFLGLGETLTLSGQIGNIQRSALFGFTEPYLFDRPISTGFTVSIRASRSTSRSRRPSCSDRKSKSIRISSRITTRTLSASPSSPVIRCGNFPLPAWD